MVLSRWIGARVRRKEDPRLFTGTSQYVDDITLPGMLYAAFVRSTYPHAIIRTIDPAPALALPGVVAVITAKDLNRWLRGSVQLGGGEGEGEAPATREGQAGPPQHELLAVDRVRYVGQPIAVVLATERYRSYDAAGAVLVDYEPLLAVVDPEQAIQDGAPQLHATLKNNIARHTQHTHGDVEKAFAEADVVIKQRFYQQRLVSVPMEPRAVAAAPDPLTRGVTVWSSTQAPHNNRNTLAQALGLSHGQVRVVAPEVGGGFGTKIGAYPEDIILAALALHLRRPVKWYETRSEHFISTNQGRGQIAYYELAATKEGRILGLRLKVIQDLGGYPKLTLLASLTSMMSIGVYDIPNLAIKTYSVCTNKTPIGAYRGAGRPEAAYYIERMIDLLARRIGKDPAEVRRLNYIPPDKFPYQSPAGALYDSADHEKALNKALEVSRY